MFVKPAEGCAVRRPDTLQLLAAAGEDVPRDEFWVRRLLQNDVIACDPPATVAPEVPGLAAPAAPAEKEPTQ